MSIFSASASAAASTRCAPARLMLRSSRTSAMHGDPLRGQRRPGPTDETADAGVADGLAVLCNRHPPKDRPHHPAAESHSLIWRPIGGSDHLRYIDKGDRARVDQG